MNKQHFIERLNLHLDGELSEEESAELLSVVRENPDYHRIYIQYCQLFNACSELGNRFSTPGRNPAWRQKLYAVGGMAAAFALLLLAARNLTPLFDDLGGGGPSLMAKTEIPSQALGNDEAGDFFSIDSKPLEGINPYQKRLDSVIPTGVFESGKLHDFGTDSEVRFGHYLNSGKKKLPSVWDRRSDFYFEEPASNSTYVHEKLIEEQAGRREFFIDSTQPLGFGEEEAEIHFVPVKAALTSTPKN